MAATGVSAPRSGDASSERAADAFSRDVRRTVKGFASSTTSRFPMRDEWRKQPSIARRQTLCENVGDTVGFGGEFEGYC
jgi:hypothetical protein